MSAKRTRRVAANARVARVAYLLSGSVRGAAEVMDRVHRAQPRLEIITPEHLDRLVVFHAREWASAARRRKTMPGHASSHAASEPDAARECHQAALAMDRQHAEAWLFRHIDEMDDAQISRAMDSSKIATQRHLDAAEVVMHSSLGERLLSTTSVLRQHIHDLKTEAFDVERREIRRARRRRLGTLLVTVGAAVLVVAIVVWTVVF